MKQIKELLEQLLEGYEKPEDLLVSEGLLAVIPIVAGQLATLRKAVMGHAVEAELTAHLGYLPHDPARRGSGNSRNGTAARRSPSTAARWNWRCRGIATAASNRSWSRGARAGCRASTSKSSPCARGA